MFARAVAILLFAGILSAQPPQRPAFEVATVKLSPNCTPSPMQPTPGRLDLRCVTLRSLIEGAYGALAGGKIANQRLKVVGGPAWLDTDKFDISAKAQGSSDLAEMIGFMLPALLEERFQLKLHKEPRETPVYTLTVAKGSPKLTPMKEGSCVPLEIKTLPKAGEPQPNYCGAPKMTFKNGAMVAEMTGITMEEFAGRLLGGQVDRPVIDKTGLTGRYDIHLEFARELPPGALLNGMPMPAPPPNDSGAPSIFTAIQQLGLKLSADKAPLDVVVVDSAQKPSEN
jgi:uncharacterized protein (TIGR03435 family)